MQIGANAINYNKYPNCQHLSFNYEQVKDEKPLLNTVSLFLSLQSFSSNKYQVTNTL